MENIYLSVSCKYLPHVSRKMVNQRKEEKSTHAATLTHEALSSFPHHRLYMCVAKKGEIDRI